MLLADRVTAIADRQRSRSRPTAVGCHTERHRAGTIAVSARNDRYPLCVTSRRPFASVQHRHGHTRIARARWDGLRLWRQRKAARRCFLHHADVALVDDDLALAHGRRRIGRRAERDCAVSLPGCRRELADPVRLCGDGPRAFRLSCHGNGSCSATGNQVRRPGCCELALGRRRPGGDRGSRRGGIATGDRDCDGCEERRQNGCVSPMHRSLAAHQLRSSASCIPCASDLPSCCRVWSVGVRAHAGSLLKFFQTGRQDRLKPDRHVRLGARRLSLLANEREE